MFLNRRLMFLNRRLRQLLCCSKFSPFSHSQKATYVDVKMKWKKDYSFDAIDILNKSKDLRPLITLKNILAKEPDTAIPISSVSKRSRELEISGRVASFLRRYPAIFEEFTGPLYNLPWFKLTPEAIELHHREKAIFQAHRDEIVYRLKRLILMSREKRLPFRIVQGMLWFLGLPEDFLRNPEELSNGSFHTVEMGDGEKGLCVEFKQDGILLSALQRNSIKLLPDTSIETPPADIAFPLFPSKGLRLKRKIENWLEEFQRLPYVSPYEDSSNLDPNSDVYEKRVVGVLHELLSLFVDNSAERRRLLCLRKHLGLPQKFGKAFERHPHVFYLLLKNKTCTVVLKEAYCASKVTGIERHPMLEVREKYVKLMSRSEAILRSCRSRKPLLDTKEEHSDVSNVEHLMGIVDMEEGPLEFEDIDESLRN